MRTSPTATTRPNATAHRVARTLTAVVPLAVLLGATPAHAAPEVYYHAGAWHAFTDKDAQGTAVCGIATENPTDGRKLSLTYTIGGSDLTVLADKPGWTIPDNTMLQANMQIDRGEPWQAQAVGHGTTVEWVISAASIRGFDTEFRNGHTMTVGFPTGNEPPWTLSLAGSTAASATLWRCVQDLSDRAHVTSPASNAPPSTQPNGQAPTQPYTPTPAQPTSPAAATPAPTPAPASGAPAQTPAAPASGAPTQTSPAPASGTPAPATKP